MNNPKPQAINDAVADAEIICPFATETAQKGRIIYAVYDASGESTGDLTEKLRELVAAPNGSALGVVVEEDPETFEEARELTWKIFEDLMVAGAVDEFGAEAEDEIRNHIQPVLAQSKDPTSVQRAMLGINGQPLFTIMTGPYYQPVRGDNQHPRYSSNFTVWCTWVQDIEWAKTNRFSEVMDVRQAMIKGFGSMYDANELVLPLNPN
jgi:hypothetical protein